VLFQLYKTGTSNPYITFKPMMHIDNSPYSRKGMIRPTDCSSQIVQKMLFNCLLEAKLMK